MLGRVRLMIVQEIIDTNKRYGGGGHKVYSEMHLKQTLGARAHSVFCDYEVDK